MVQSSLKLLLGSSRRYKRLTWRSQGQLQLRRRFCSKLQIKRIHNKHTHICGAFCDINRTLIKSVWNYTKRYPRPFVLILWTSSFTPQVMKMLILIANSHRPFITVQWFLACQYLKWLFSYSNHPSSFKTYWLLLLRSHSSWGQKLVTTPLALCAMQGRFWIHHKVHSK